MAIACAPPRHRIQFQHGSSLTDRVFYRFLAAERGITEVDAVRQFQDFAYQLRTKINNHPFVELAGVGILRKNQVGELTFEPGADVDLFYAPLSLPEVAAIPHASVPSPDQPDSGESSYEDDHYVPKDRWWIWALLLFFAGLAAIVYHLMDEGVIR